MSGGYIEVRSDAGEVQLLGQVDPDEAQALSAALMAGLPRVRGKKKRRLVEGLAIELHTEADLLRKAAR